MNFGTLVKGSLRFHFRAHLGVCLGALIGSTALIGALVVGDSVRESLRQQALSRVGKAWFALVSADRLFTSKLVTSSNSSGKATGIASLAPTVTLLALPGTASRPGGEARANQIQIFGVVDGWSFAGLGQTRLSPGTVLLNPSLASQLGAKKGDDVLLRTTQNEQLSPDSPIAPRDDRGIALTLKVAGIFGGDSGGDLNLRSSGLPPMNAFVRAEELWAASDLKGKANLFLVGQPHESKLGALQIEAALSFLNDALQHSWTLEDTGLKLEQTPGDPGIELRSSRVFLEPQTVSAAKKIHPTNSVLILTYLANLIVAGTNNTPYSMVTAVGPPYTPSGMNDEEIVVNDWLAQDLGVKPGDPLSLSYFEPESGAKLIEKTNLFRVHSVVPMEMPWVDQTLMPDFPGIEKAENPRDWNAGFPLVHKIRPKDEDYWKKYRGTPKAFITLAAGQKMWANRFGSLTAIRFPNASSDTQVQRRSLANNLLATMTPAQFGFQFEPVREQALKAAEQSQDFGGLFLGFSIFVVISALLLMGLLFQFALEQRAVEIGTLLALGFTPRQIRRLLLLEGAALALIGGVAGVLGGLGYARAMLLGLTTIWHSAIGASSLQFHCTPWSLLIGLAASGVVACLTIWLTLRKQAQQPAQELLAGKVQIARGGGRSYSIWFAGVTGVPALLLIAWAFWKQDSSNAEIFFGAGSLLLASGLALAAVLLATLETQVSANTLSMSGLALRNCARRRKRSITTMALLASGCFVISAISAFRLDAARDAGRLDSGTGGFALLGRSTLPLTQDLNSPSGREAFGLSAEELAGVTFVPMRVREGDEASCLNLSRAQKPRLLGVKPELMKNRFTFSKAAVGLEIQKKWDLLKDQNKNTASSEDEIPAIGDANSIQWALGKKLGETLEYIDEQGRPFKLRLVGSVANSILQGNLIIDEAQFVKRFSGQGGYQFFLLDAPSNRVSEVSRVLSRALQDKGLELTSTVQRLDAFNAVQNTYLGTFQILGGLGLLLGSAGLGVVVLRNVLERRGEIGLLLAVGFRRGRLQKLILVEHSALLGLGLGIGIAAAAVAVLPALLSPGGHLPYASLATTLSAVLLNGALWTWVAIRWAIRGDLLKSLRNE